MWRQTIKIAFRNLFKQKLFSSINIFGLAIGLAGSLLIAVFVWNELSYESMHDKADNIYRIAVQFGKSDDSMILAGAMPALGPAVKEELPEVDEFSRVLLDRNAPIVIGDNEFIERKFFLADPSIFSLFNIDIISESDDSPLSDPFDVMLSESTAKKYFGNVNPLSKTFQYREQTLIVTGIYRDIKGNTQIDPDLIASYKTKEVVFPNGNQWGSFGQDLTYLLLNKEISASELEKKITDVVIRNTSAQFGDMLRFIPEHLPDVYLNSRTVGDVIEHGNKSYVYLFSTIALFVLFIAALNFINLSTARSFKRSKEVGIKKVMGAQRKQLISQFLTESLLITFIALIIGLVLFELIYPILIDFLGIRVGIDYLTSLQFYLMIAFVLFAVGLLAGIYPAFYLTHFNPIKTVKNEVGKTYKGLGFRKVLVISQFVISILLIFGTTVIFQQLNYMKDYDIGLDKNNIVLIKYVPDEEVAETRYETFKNKLLTSEFIKSVSGVYTLPGINSIQQQTIRLKGTPEDEQKIMRFNGVDFSFINTFGINLIAGRNFSKDFSTDRNHAVIINETALKELGLELDNAIGKEVSLPSSDNNEKLATIIGITKDFNIESLHNSIDPVVLYIDPERFYTIAVKTTSQNNQQVLKYIENTWNELMPNKKFNYSFMQDTYNQLYSSEDKISEVFTIFSFLAIYIATLGLLGLSSFSAEQRKKEIGIRKVLGSTIANIVGLMSKDYLKLVLVSSIIALPISFYLLNEWLSDFAFRIEISWLPFILAFSLSLIISLITVSSQALRAATLNPIDSIKYE